MKTVEALKELLAFAEAQLCLHENTYRGGAIWEICQDCGEKWADDEGGKPEYTEPKEITAARKAIEKLEHLDCLYEVGETIEVSENNNFQPKLRPSKFLFMGADGSVWVQSNYDDEIAYNRFFHRKIPKTIPLNLDADVVEDAKIGLGGATATDRGDGIVEINNRAFVRLLRVSSAIAQAAQGGKGEC